MSAEPLTGWGTIAAVASVTPRAHPEHNEDAAVDFRAADAGVCGVVVADGVGSYSQAKGAARYAAEEAAAVLRDAPAEFDGAILPRLFAQVYAGLRAHARQAAAGNAPEQRAFGTTLLVGVDAGATLWGGYVGNGAIWHIRGNLEGFATTPLPWNAVNLLNPHSVLRDGREVLYNLLDAAEPSPPMPSVVSVQKDPRFGDVLLLCTDGICSADQVTHGTDAEGGAWISAEATMVVFHRNLRALFAEWDGESELPLQAALESYLHDLRNGELLEDDATVGVIVTADVLRYQREVARSRMAHATAEAPALETAEPVAKHADTVAVDGQTPDAAIDAASGAPEDVECLRSPSSPV
jgi:serine/threonine protein phosphatase PrpC